VGTSEETQKTISVAAGCLKQCGAREVFVFGSAAEGIMRENSDIDLAVSGLPPEIFFRAMNRTSSLLHRPLDLVDLDEETPFTQYLRRKGKLRRVG
jgi:predicted nucleotidyltransferase